MRLSAIIEAFSEIKRTDVDFWMREGALRTRYAETISGKPRQYSRRNAVELAAMARLVHSGAPYRRAAVWADLLVRLYEERRLAIGSRDRWYVVPTGNFDSATTTNLLTPRTLEHAATASAYGSALVLDMHLLFDKIDALFDEGES